MHFPMPDTESCYFCEIINAVSPGWQIVEETDLTVTLLNGRQFEIGQCIVIPRRHAQTVLDLDSAEESAIMSAARRVARALVNAYSPDGMLLYQNNGLGSGLEVPHFHMHVVPRQPGSDWGFGPPHLQRLEREGRLKHHDHSGITDDKLETVETVKRNL